MRTSRKLFAGILMLSATALNAQVNITLQPDSVTGKDAELFSCIPCGYSNTNYGNSSESNALAWTNLGEDSYVRSLLDFDLTSIPQNSVVNQAFLSLYFNSQSIEGEHSSLTGSNEAVLHRVTSSWDENTVTWETQPTTSTVNEVTVSQSIVDTQDYLNINVTDLVQDMLNNPTTSFGFLLKVVTEEPYRRLVFASSDHPNDSLHPKLDITYTAVTSVSRNLEDDRIFTVYPNPTSQVLNLNLNTDEVDSIEIVNGLGQTLKKINSPNKFESIDTSDLPRGLVFVRLQSSTMVSTQKVLLVN